MPWGRRRAAAEADPFVGAVREACSRLGLVVVSLEGDLAVLSGRIEGTVALEDVRARCALEPPQQWPALVGETLQGLARSLESPVDLVDAAAVRPLLRSRVSTEGAVLLDDVVRRPFADGLVEVLVAEVAGAVRAVPPSVVASWGVPADDLLDLGRGQVRAAGLPAARAVDLGGVEALALESPSAFTATHVCWLGRCVDVPAAGALVALPTRHLLLCAPMTARGAALDAAQALLVNAEALEQAGPGPLSPDLWWWRAGSLVRLPGTPTGLAPPLAFLEVLDALPG